MIIKYNISNKIKFILRKIKKQVVLFLCKSNPKLASKIMYYDAFKQKLNLKDPKEFNEKLMWLKLNKYTDNELVTKCADKLLVRDYVEEQGLGFLLNDLIDVYENADDINWDLLPNKFALKCNHGAGFNIICSDKSRLDVEETKRKLNEFIATNYADLYAETQYKKIKRKIICEKFIECKEGQNSISDYKVFCFSGHAKLIMYCGNRGLNTEYHFFDNEWNHLPINPYYGSLSDFNNCLKPENLKEILNYAEILSKPFPFVRVDFYDVNSVVFGELTFTPTACLDADFTNEAALWLGSMIDIHY